MGCWDKDKKKINDFIFWIGLIETFHFTRHAINKEKTTQFFSSEWEELIVFICCGGWRREGDWLDCFAFFLVVGYERRELRHGSAQGRQAKQNNQLTQQTLLSSSSQRNEASWRRKREGALAFFINEWMRLLFALLVFEWVSGLGPSQGN